MSVPNSANDINITSAGNIKITSAQTLPVNTGLTGAILTTGGYNGTTYGTMLGNTTTYNVTFTMPPVDILNVKNAAGKEIVRMTQHGEVIWADPEMNENEAAQALSRSLVGAAELKVGITNSVKAKMRDTVFEEIIAIAEGKGALTVDDLTYLYEASKIMEKLKGG